MVLEAPLSKVKGLGSAKEGSEHWLKQRITAAALIPLIIWFVFSLVKISDAKASLVSMISSPLGAIFLSFFVCTSLYHGYMGLRVVIEDYIKGLYLRFIIITFICFLSLVLGFGSLLAIVKGHIDYSNHSFSEAFELKLSSYDHNGYGYLYDIKNI